MYRPSMITSTSGFLSTPSARRATVAAEPNREAVDDFYPRPPRGGRRAGHIALFDKTLFLSTPSARRATCRIRPLPGYKSISIHALREEGDQIRI